MVAQLVLVQSVGVRIPAGLPQYSQSRMWPENKLSFACRPMAGISRPAGFDEASLGAEKGRAWRGSAGPKRRSLEANPCRAATILSE
jgi:hypothetical protein